MAIRAVIFDRDGVLTFFEFAPVRALLAEAGLDFHEVRVAWEQWYRARALPRTIGEEQVFVGDFFAEYCAARGSSTRVREMVAAYDYATMVRPFADARPALTAARALELKTGVLSNFPMLRLEDSLRGVGLWDLLDGAWAAAAIGVAKPGRDAYLAVADGLGVRPDECAFVDDEDECVRGARSVGMFAVRLDRGASELGEGVVSTLTEFMERVRWMCR